MKRIFAIILMFAALTFAAVFSSHVSIAQSNSATTDFAPAAIIAEENCDQGFNCGRIAYTDYVGENNTIYIYTMNRDGSERRLVISLDPPGNNFGKTEIKFSPDNRKLLFLASSYSGFDENIWTVNVDGTGLTDLTQSFSFNRFPVFSPDGTKIAFLSSRDTGTNFHKIYIMNSDGSGVRRLTDVSLAYGEFSPSFSPDGSHIVFMLYQLTNAFRDICTIGTDGTGLTNLTNTEAHFDSNVSPAYTPDGNTIVFVSGRDYGVGSGGGRNEIYRMSADGSNQTRLTNLSSFKGDEDRSLIISPDGSRVLFDNSDSEDSDKEVYLVGTDGSGLTNLSNDPDKDNSAVQFSPDGTKVCFTSLIMFTSFTADIVNIDGSNRVTISDPVVRRYFGSFGKPDTDNDGIIDGADNCPLTANQYRFAFATTVTGTTNPEIYTQNFDGTNQIRLTNDGANDLSPSFNRSGTQIVWESNRSSNRYEIFKINANGTGTVRLTNIAGGNQSPTFSPDGSKITFDSARAGQRNIFIMNADGTSQTQVTFITAGLNSASNPSFNQNGTRIAFESQRGTINSLNTDIYSIKTDGTGGEVRLTTATGKDQLPAYSPDGSKIVFVSFRDGDSLGGEIYIMNADGSNQTRLTNNAIADTEPTFTPDGSHIMYASSAGTIIMNMNGRDATLVPGGGAHPSFAPQADRDGDGIGDACENPALFDYDGDGKSDVSVFRPSNSVWYLQQSQAGLTGVQFGISTDKIAPADYDGDGKTDIAVYRPSDGTWYLLRSSSGFTAVQFGANGDIPAPADFDGDGKADIALFRPSSGVWYLIGSTAGNSSTQFGVSGDVPVAGDYDGDGRADLAAFRPSNGVWYELLSSAGFKAVQFGISTDLPVKADYDGDGKTDPAVFRPATGTWYLLQSSTGLNISQFGQNADRPTPADYDGDGRADLAVFRPSNGTWYLLRSTAGFTAQQFGSTGDIATPAAFVP